MNMNEVVAHIANRKLEKAGSTLRVHPNDDVNMAQSSNDTFPTALHVAAVYSLHHYLYGPLNDLTATFEAKSREYMHTVKSAVPMCRMRYPSPLVRKYLAGWKC